MVTIDCPCGRQFMTAAEDIGQRIRCPKCQQLVVAVEAPGTRKPEPIDYQALTLDVGTVSGVDGVVALSLRVLADGRGFVLLYANDDNRRHEERLVPLSRRDYRLLKELIVKMDATIARLESRGDMKGIE